VADDTQQSADSSRKPTPLWVTILAWAICLYFVSVGSAAIITGRLFAGILCLAGAATIFPPAVRFFESKYHVTVAGWKRWAAAGGLIIAAYIVLDALDPRANLATDTAKSCLVDQVNRRQVEMRGLSTSGPRRTSLSPAQKLNGITYISHFDMHFTARPPNGDWQDYSMSMTATIQNQKLSVGVWMNDIPMFLGFGGWQCEKQL
jgi:hypothetical protein